MYHKMFLMKIFIYVFQIIFKHWMGLINLKGDVFNGTTQGWVCPLMVPTFIS